MYKIGDEIRCTYQNPPIPEEDRYKIGQHIQVWDQDTKKRIATYLVAKSGDTHIDGIVIWVAEPMET